jgi:hypothetical protein
VSLVVSTAVQRIRFHLGDLPWETVGSGPGVGNEVTVEDGEDWAIGDIGEFQDDGESFWVRTPDSFEIEVTRGYYGTTQSTHSSDTRILKNPKYRYSEIVNAITATIQGFLPSDRVYKVTADTITPDAADTTWYDLAADALGLVSVEQLVNTELMKYGQHHAWGRVQFQRNLPMSLVASGVGVAFPDGFADVSSTVYINYAAKITASVTSGEYDDFSDGEAVTEAIIYGAVALLQGSLELRKPRKGAAETNNLQSASYFNRIYHSALNQAAKEIRQQAPLMQTSRLV